MNIIVCVKQVPDTTEIKIDPVKKTLIRDGVPSILNPFDGYALEAALRMKDKDPSVKITAVSMGPQQAKAVLKEAVSVGCDQAYLLSDRAFGGSDTLATSYIISNAIKEIEKREGVTYDVILCGKQAIDGDTAQVGPEIAEHLDLPQVTYAWEMKANEDGSVTVKREVEEGYEMIKAATPCLVTFTKPDFTETINGGPLTLEFASSMFADEDSVKKVAALVKAYIDMSGHQLQLNAVNSELLKAAQEHPEEHRQLVVRIWGWSAYFVELDKEYQDHVLMRQQYRV